MWCSGEGYSTYGRVGLGRYILDALIGGALANRGRGLRDHGFPGLLTCDNGSVGDHVFPGGEVGLGWIRWPVGAWKGGRIIQWQASGLI